LLIFVFNLPKLFTVIKNTNKKYLLGFVLFIIFLLIGLINSKNLGAGIYGVVKLSEFVFLAFFISSNYQYLKKNILFFAILISLVFESLLTIWQYFNQGSINSIFYFLGERAFNASTPGIANASINGQLFLRPYATFSHPNVLAGFLVISMLLLYLFYFKNKYTKLFLCIGSILGTGALLLTLSRSAIFIWVICLIVLFGLWLVEKYKKGKFNSLKITLPFLILLTVGTFFILQNNYVVQRFITTKLSDESVIQRQDLINQSLKMFVNSPVFGVGINNFYNNLNVVASNQNNYLIQPVHNIFLLVMSETGIVGLFFLAVIFIKSIFVSLRNKQNKKYLLLLIFAIFFLGMFDHYFLTLQQGQLLITFIIGIALRKS
jgi:O-antigen ligase